MLRISEDEPSITNLDMPKPGAITGIVTAKSLNIVFTLDVRETE